MLDRILRVPTRIYSSELSPLDRIKPGHNHPLSFGAEVRAHSLKSRQGVAQDRNRLLIVNDLEPALRSLNKLMCVNGGKRRRVVRALSGSKNWHAKCAKQTPHKTEVHTSSFCSIWFGVGRDICIQHQSGVAAVYCFITIGRGLQLFIGLEEC